MCRTFTFTTKTPPTSWFIKRCAKIDTGAKRPGHETVGKIHVKQVYEIALAKQQDEHLRHIDLEMLCRQVMGSCRSMGVDVVNS